MDRIKESFDSLPIAVCFFDKNGVVRLINHRMLAIASQLRKGGIQTLAELHDALRNGADVERADLLHDTLDLLRRDAVAAQTQPEEGVELFLKREVLRAGMRHVPAHDARGAELHNIKIALGHFGMVGAENGVQLLRRLAEDVLRGFVLRVGFDVDLTQVLVELRERELDGGLHGIDEYRRKVRVGNAPGHAELVVEHELDELGEHAVLGAENILERAVGNIRLLHDLGDGRSLVALFQKQLYAYGEDPPFGGQTGTCDSDGNHFLWKTY